MRVQALAVAARAVAVAALGDLPVVVAVGRVAALVKQGDREPWTHLLEHEQERDILPQADLRDTAKS